MRGVRNDFTGRQFGDWTVLKEDRGRRNKIIWWKCRCVCGTLKVLSNQSLQQGKPERLNCGCRVRQELLGHVFGRLTVKRYIGLKNGLRLWKCECACGAEFIANGNELKRGNTSSCGCWRREQIQRKSITHGMSYSPEYQAWAAAKDRCSNPNNIGYDNYGGRGIRMCVEWLDDFMAFYSHVGPRLSDEHSLDRIRVNGHYEPGNVRWATKTVQIHNRRPPSEWKTKTA